MKISSLRTSGVAAFVGIALASTLLLGSSAIAQAQSINLTQLIQLLVAAGVITPDKEAAALAAVSALNTTPVTSSSYTYTRNLTVGSTGADVTALQNATGVTPATGFFGPITQAAVAKWQASVGLPATGFFGPLSIAKLNASGSMTTTTTTTTTNNTTTINNTGTTVAGCVPGAMFSSTTGATCATTTTTVSTNTGVEGILTVNLNPVPSSGQNVYEGDTMDSLLGIKLQAQLSPITIQRVQIDLGNSTAFYTKVFQTLYLVSDTGQTLAQATLNGNTVTKQTNGSTNTYYLNFSGFNYKVPGDNSVHVLTVKGDLYSSIDLSDSNLTSAFPSDVVPVTIDTNGIRGVDGAGVDQYGPISGSISNSVVINNALSDSAQLQISTDSATPLATSVVANTGSNNNEADGVTVLVFDAYAQKDNISLQDVSGTTTLSAPGHAAPTTAYLYDGSNQIGSAAISYSGTTGTFTFQNITSTIPANSSKAYTVKEDIKSADTTAIGQSTTIQAVGVNAENSVGDTVSGSNLTGSAIGNTFTVLQKGPVFTLVSATMSTPSVAQNTTTGVATSTASALFTVGIQAIGGNLYFGTQAASSTFQFAPYQDGAYFSNSNNASSTSITIPSSGVTTTGLTGANQFELAQNNTVQIPVTFTLSSRSSNGTQVLPSGHQYSVQLTGITWSLTGNDTQISTFMGGQTSWRTPSVLFAQ